MNLKLADKLKCFVVLSIFLAFTNILKAQTPFIFKGERQLVISNSLLILDSSAKEPVENIDQKFKNGNGIPGYLNLDHVDDAVWIKLVIMNQSADSDLVVQIENPLVDSVDLFLIQTGVYLRQHIYMLEPFSNREIRSTFLSFPIKVKTRQQVEILMRIKNTEQMLLPVSVSTYQSVLNQSNQRDLVFGIFIGVILVMLFYNLFVFYSTKDSNYLYYVIYIFFIGIAQITMSGESLSLLFGFYPIAFKYFIIVLPALSGVFAVVFIRQFLHTKLFEPKLDIALTIVQFLYLLTAIARILGWFHVSSRMMDLFGIPGVILVYVVAIRIYNKGIKSALYFLIAWSVFILGVLLFVLRNLNILPFNNITSYTLPMGAAFEVALLSFALADKINTLQAQKLEKEKEALEAALENEKLIREQNIVLEQKVKERTLDLANSNNQLTETLQDLKETQSQLVDQEKMASLGQLTAGIAHEINNPINFVTSNINPLKRDITMILNLYSQVEELCIASTSSDEKSKLIDNWKEEIEYDYLKSEIEFLLKGIDDGANRTAEIVKGLRIFARSDDSSLETVNVIEGIISTLVIVNNQLGKIEVKKHFEGESVIDCFPGKLNQVFLNLISNAIQAIQSKFGENNGGEIMISSRSDEEYIYIEIADNGIGMNEEIQKKIFEPFFTTKQVGQGTGLGLSIVFKTIEIHKGKITVKSVEGEGSTFEIRLSIKH